MKKYNISGIMNIVLKQITNLSRKSKIGIQVATDIIVAFACFPCALLLANENPKIIADPKIFMALVFSITILVVAFAGFGLYQSLVRFITGTTLIIITKGTVVGSCSLALFSLLLKPIYL